MKIHANEITSDIEAADFSTDAAALAFRAKMCSDYCARELFAYEDFLSCWSFETQGELQRLERTWNSLTREARSLISQARTLGVGAIKNRLVIGADGTMLPNPLMLDDLDDGLYDMPILALRRTVARALENNTTLQDVAKDSKRGADAAERTEEQVKAHRKDKPKRKNNVPAKVWYCNREIKLTAKWLASALDRHKKQLEGKNWTGNCSERLIQQWDAWCAANPDEDHKWGYRTELRTDRKNFDELMHLVQRWKDYHQDKLNHFKEWRRNHPGIAFECFKYVPEKRADIDTNKIGSDKHGKLVIEPRPDSRRT